MYVYSVTCERCGIEHSSPKNAETYFEGSYICKHCRQAVQHELFDALGDD